MTDKYIIVAVSIAGLILVLGLGFVANKLRSPQLKTEYFKKKWDDVQKLCGDKITWPLAVINGDKLLDEALKKRHYKGKSMGERLVAAQRELTNNDQVWHAHKLRNKLVHENNPPKLRKREVLNVMVAQRQALKDLGALR